MKKIKLRVASRGLYLLHYFGSFILALIISIFIFRFIENKNKIVFLAIYIAIWYLISRFTKRIPKGQVELEIKEGGLQVIWLKQFFLHKKKDTLIQWKDFKDYMFQPDQYFDLLRIRTKDKKKFKFSMIGENDGFLAFYQRLEEVMKSKSTDELIQINRAKNIYETKYGLISAIFMGLVLVTCIVAFIFIEPKGNSKSNYGLLIVSLSGAIFFISQVISYRKKNKN